METTIMVYVGIILGLYVIFWTFLDFLAFCPSLSLDHVAGLTLDWGLCSV